MAITLNIVLCLLYDFKICRNHHETLCNYMTKKQTVVNIDYLLTSLNNILILILIFFLIFINVELNLNILIFINAFNNS